MSHQADERTRTAFYEKHPELVQYFVKGMLTCLSNISHTCLHTGAPVFITENLSPERKLANGSAARLHSLILQVGLEATDDFQIRFTAATPGTFVDLFEPPFAVNVQLLGISVHNWPASKTLVPDAVVIPLPLQRRSESIILRRRHAGIAELKVSCKPLMYELGFAVT